MVWAFIAHRDKVWAGVISGESSKAELGKFLGDFAARGCEIMTVNSREEYNAELAARRPRVQKEK